MFENGRRYICDRCNAEIFCACIGEGESDGGFTRWHKFQPLPDGWKTYSLGLLCPVCSRIFEDLVDRFMQGGA